MVKDSIGSKMHTFPSSLKTKLCAVFIFSLFLYSIAWAEENQQVKFGISFPPAKNREELEFSLKWLTDLHVSTIRLSESWKKREKRPGEFDWTSLDERIDFASANGLSLMLTIESTAPSWECLAHPDDRSCVFSDEAHFSRYIRLLLLRYSGKIDKIQFGNEWDAWWGYSGSAEDFTRFNNIVYALTKELSPTTAVVLGGVTPTLAACILFYRDGRDMFLPGQDVLEKNVTPQGIRSSQNRELDGFLKKGIEKRVSSVFQNAKYDMIDVHLYDWPENWSAILDFYRQMTGKPVLVSEFECVHPAYEKYSQDFQAGRLQTCLETLAKMSVLEAYHFSLVDIPGSSHKNSGLIDQGLGLKKAYSVFKNFITKSRP
jgi:hypothetical protein